MKYVTAQCSEIIVNHDGNPKQACKNCSQQQKEKFYLHIASIREKSVTKTGNAVRRVAELNHQPAAIKNKNLFHCLCLVE
jgi:hypothetical protein